MNDKFLGIGLKNALGLFFLFMVFRIVLKVIFTMYEIEGASEVVRMGA